MKIKNISSIKRTVSGIGAFEPGEEKEISDYVARQLARDAEIWQADKMSKDDCRLTNDKTKDNRKVPKTVHSGYAEESEGIKIEKEKEDE